MRLRSSASPQRGFNLLETMIVTGVLAISAGVLVDLHAKAVRGIEQSEDMSVALTIANQKAEEVAVMGFVAAPTCQGPPTGCMVDFNTMAGALGPANGFQCTRNVDGADIPGANNVQGPAGTRYRVDVTVDPPADPNQPDARIITVSVCWVTVRRQVRQVQTRRMIVSGV